jgi:hypothetical protein
MSACVALFGHEATAGKGVTQAGASNSAIAQALMRRLGHNECGIYAEVIAPAPLPRATRSRPSRNCCELGSTATPLQAIGHHEEWIASSLNAPPNDDFNSSA